LPSSFTWATAWPEKLSATVKAVHVFSNEFIIDLPFLRLAAKPVSVFAGDRARTEKLSVRPSDLMSL
jgi:hypothetical protein